MTKEIEKQFFKAFEIPHKVRNWCQYNYAQAEKGLEIFPERKKLEDQGLITITHLMLNPRPENDCVYWEELHYPEITAEKVIELIVILSKINLGMDCCCFITACENIKDLIKDVLEQCIELKDKLKPQIQELF